MSKPARVPWRPVLLAALRCEACGAGGVACVRPGADPLPAVARSPEGVTTVVCQLVLAQRDIGWCLSCAAARGWLVAA